VEILAQLLVNGLIAGGTYALECPMGGSGEAN
jgi:hypothetical protein